MFCAKWWDKAFDTQSKTRVAFTITMIFLIRRERECVCEKREQEYSSPQTSTATQIVLRWCMYMLLSPFIRFHHCAVIISRFELVEIIMHSSHSVVFVNDWPAVLIYRDDCRQFTKLNHIGHECCPKIKCPWLKIRHSAFSPMILITKHQILIRNNVYS